MKLLAWQTKLGKMPGRRKTKPKIIHGNDQQISIKEVKKMYH